MNSSFERSASVVAAGNAALHPQAIAEPLQFHHIVHNNIYPDLSLLAHPTSINIERAPNQIANTSLLVLTCRETQ